MGLLDRFHLSKDNKDVISVIPQGNKFYVRGHHHSLEYRVINTNMTKRELNAFIKKENLNYLSV